MGRVCVSLKSKGVDIVVLNNSEELNILRRKDIEQKMVDLALRYVGAVSDEIEKMDEISERQKLMAELIVLQNITHAIENSIFEMYEEGLLEKV